MTITPVGLVEAALFSSGKPMTVDEVVQATKLSLPEVQSALKELQTQYAARDTALEVVKSGLKWAMAVRTLYSDSTRMLAAPEIPRKVLKTLALIAFHQPIKQSDLKDMVGSVVYDHVKELHERGMVTSRQEGITKILATTDRFIEYFGLDATNREELRTELAKRVGLDLAKLPPVHSSSETHSPASDPADAQTKAPSTEPVEASATPSL